MATIITVLALSACKPDETNDLYAITPDLAYARLLRADLKGFRDARQCGMLIYFSADLAPGRAISWNFTSSNIRVARFTVLFTPHDKSTRITIDVPKGPNGDEIYNGKQTYNYPGIMQPLRPAVRELINSAIEERAYDWRRIPDPLNTDITCSGTRQNFLARRIPYSINDPADMATDTATEFRQRGATLKVTRDRYFEGQ